MSRSQRVPPFIYFFAPVGGGPIKIGCSESALTRLKILAGWSPLPLTLLATAPGRIRDEGHIHSLFQKHWSHREWFNPAPEIFALIEEIKTTGELPQYARWKAKVPVWKPRLGMKSVSSCGAPA